MGTAASFTLAGFSAMILPETQGADPDPPTDEKRSRWRVLSFSGIVYLIASSVFFALESGEYFVSVGVPSSSKLRSTFIKIHHRLRHTLIHGGLE